MQTAVIVWLVILVALSIIELATVQLTAVWFCFGALLAMAAAAINFDVTIQLIVFIITSVVLLIFTRPIALRLLTPKMQRTNADRVVGEIGIVTEDISNLDNTGQVKAIGQIWTARTDSDEEKIAKGARVEIMQISGVKLIVKEARQKSAVESDN